MAKIQLVIDAEDTNDLRATLQGLLAGTAIAAALGTAGEAQYLDAVGSEKEGAEAPQRTRRTKAQIAADAAAQSATPGNPTSASATTASDASQGQAGSSPAPSSMADQIKQAAAEVAADDAKAGGAPTEADVKAAMTAHMGKHSAVKTQAALEAAVGVKRISEIPPEKYGEAIAALEAEL